ncbi:cytochrome c [Sphingomonas lutea]|uniref:Cytochrome c n=1 Tax=Sphingomonas lutea TaxID=1045317 RepID=A0A7G9SGV9_9SPHN|nr:cytochrome c [Sphingomonas lutea]QNN67084.1 cytochrome c [Sphingomonas lutea]
MKSLFTAVAAAALLAGCNQSDNANEALADANASGNAAAAAVENAVAAAPATPLQKEQALALMKERHENYEKIGDAMKVIGRELKSDSPDLAAVRTNADAIATLAPQVKGWFPQGTGPDVGKTEALAAIWEKPEDFAAKAAEFERAAAAFQAATRGTDVAAMRAAQGNLGKSCKACHDLYREEHD